jgi:predicted Zn-dependent protease with MMP-like domain
MLSLSTAAFEKLVQEAWDAIPKEFRNLAKEVAVTVQARPGTEAEGIRGPNLLLGLYLGPSYAQIRSPLGPTAPSPRIVLYQQNIQSICDDEGRLRREVALTLRHELGHYLGFSDKELEKRWPEGA